ncbi:acetolactate synthase [Phragmitibacter flavus]|uniref:Acetolactate synthase n=1 Tax=Phragmitibacter flavus TaxID=2576071 RepID=A0A5R8K959_9BACT|nr:acetolactate synthase [Phragmitibacter flavus]TLD68475.1 acetolactate synthase [Phragmitibacter flavus]
MSSKTSFVSSLSTTNARSPVRQLSVFLHNRVGAFLTLVKLLNDHHIEVLGFSLQDSIDLTLVRLIVSDPESAKDLFDEQGHSCAIKTVVVVALEEGAPDLCQALASLLAAEINIHHSYPLLVRHQDKPLLALCVEDGEVGEEALRKTGYQVLCQNDLSR